MNEELEEQLIRHEGLRLFPYKDTVGKLTIGVGRNIEDNGISEKEAMYLLKNDIERCSKILQENFYFYNFLTHTRKCVLVNMCFNLGFPRLMGFKKMLAALETHDYDTAADEMEDSKWARQVKGRAVELANQMRDGG
jgi:lysozyme